jgi:hypothetical protein
VGGIGGLAIGTQDRDGWSGSHCEELTCFNRDECQYLGDVEVKIRLGADQGFSTVGWTDLGEWMVCRRVG